MAARAWGVSLSEFAGRPAVTRHYDTNERLTGVSVAEARWTDTDRDLALQLAAYEASLCPSCREPLAETTAAENEFAYRPEPVIRCHRCTAAAIASETLQGNPHPEALFVPVRLRERTVTSDGDGCADHGGGGPEAGHEADPVGSQSEAG
jgi:hypothetical protein